jgi:uncharacterized membrane protein YjgN (DUF898 family)
MLWQTPIRFAYAGTCQAGGRSGLTVSFLLPSILCATAVAWLFPPVKKESSLAAMARAFFSGRRTGAWVWRVAVAAVVFVPIYLVFGSLVAPLTAQYFQESMYGLRQPGQNEILVVLLVRSALFLLVGFLYMLGAYYMPLAVRVPHTLEILADSFTHTGLLVVLPAKSNSQTIQTLEAHAVQCAGPIRRHCDANRHLNL